MTSRINGIGGTDGFIIESDIPIPDKSRVGRYPISHMKIRTQSLLVKTENEARAARCAAHTQGCRITTRKQENGYRVWRIA